MSALPRFLSRGLHLSLLATLAVGAGAGCSKSDTVVALVISVDSDLLGTVSKIHVTVTPESGTPVTDDITPTRTDGAIMMTLMATRYTLNGAKGTVTVRADGLDDANAVAGWGTTSAQIVEEGAVATRVTIKVGGGQTGDGGTDGGGDDGGADGGASAGDAADDASGG